MRYINFGRTNLDVSRVAFGTWQLSGEWGGFDADAATAAIRRARDLGVTFFDTAYAYGEGASEKLLGAALADDLQHRREEVVIATKGGITPGHERSRNAGREALREQVHSSLKSLGVERIDLYQIHWPDPQTPAAETAGALEELVVEGKIGHYGVSNYSLAELEDFEAHQPVQSLQPPYHLFRRGIEDDVLPWCRSHDVGVLAYSSLGSGLLTGTLNQDTTFDEDDWRSQSAAFQGKELKQNLGVVERLRGVASDKGISVPQLAIAWVLAQPGVHVAIVGARSERNVADSLAAADVDLSEDELRQIAEIADDGYQITEAATPEGVH